MSGPVAEETQAEVPAQQTAPVVLDVRKLSRTFGAVHALAGASFRVHQGQIFGFVGPNGAGKTTTLKLLATLDLPTSGDALVCGESIARTPERVRPLIGYMPDQSAVFPDTTVFEHLDFFARAYGLRGAARKKRLDSVIAFTQLTPLVDKLMTALSKGMRQRVALARTLLHDPALLILDEPADGLDPRARIELRELLVALAGQGKAILVSSHILPELSEICDSCAIIEQGRILATGSVSAILAGSVTESDPAKPLLELVLQLVSGPELEAASLRCEKLLLEQPDVVDVLASAGTIRFRVAGDQQKARDLLRILVQADVPVCSFHLYEANLEDAFMRVTKGLVQ
jgi:ABC-2 type transport system ATP-binding protein